MSMTIDQLGEAGLIDQATRDLPMPPAVSVGPGDDAAVFLVNGSAVVSTDILVEGVHFRRDWSSASEVGRKAVAVNVADLEAMGARPITMVVTFSAPGELDSTWVREFLTGLRDEADAAQIALVGGDVTRSRDITVGVTVIGQTEGWSPVLRSGACPGDVVAIRGRLGWAAAGHAALARGFRSPRAVVDAQRVPQVPYGEGRIAARSGATSMIDVSDGLLSDLGKIAEQSAVEIRLDSAAFEIAEPIQTVSAALGRVPLDFVLTGGEDHALAATFPPEQVPEDWKVVGTVGEIGMNDAGVLVDGKVYEPTQAGWTHFSAA